MITLVVLIKKELFLEKIPKIPKNFLSIYF